MTPCELACRTCRLCGRRRFSRRAWSRTRNGQDEERFDREIARQLSALGIAASAIRGRRRIVRIKDKSVVGYAVRIAGLNDAESLRLQEHGLGGRRKMGCGVFVPVRGSEKQ